MKHPGREGEPPQAQVPGLNRFQRTTFRPVNEMTKAFNAVAPMPGAVRQVIPGAGSVGTLIIRQFQITGMDGDYFEAKAYDGTTQTGSAIKIAKPFQLRRTPFDGEYISGLQVSYSYSSDTTRTATHDDEDEEQLVIPKYLIDFSVIFAVKPVAGSTGVTWFDGEGDVPIGWLDLNLDARAWAREA